MQLVNITDYMSGKPLHGSVLCAERLPPDPLKSAAPRFSRLRLLTPNTRAQRHLYQTWHSLPERHCGDPGNQGSMFTVLHRSQATSLTIHPERVQHPDSLTVHPERYSLTIHPEHSYCIIELNFSSASQVPPPSSCGSTALPTAAQDPTTSLDRILTPPLSVQAPPTPCHRSQAPPLPPVQSTNGLFPAIHESQQGPKTVPSAEQRGGLTGLHKDSRLASKDGVTLVKLGTAVDAAPSVADKENTSRASSSQQNLMGPQSPGSVQRLPPDLLKSVAPRFSCLRLLTPNTRAQRHLYQTWHSLPEQHCGDPGNQGSMFTVLHRSQAASFTIHPESPGSVQRLPPDPLKSAAPRFSRLRLLTPNTRAQRHLYQTWHSLPERHCGDPGNQGSMFTVLHRKHPDSLTIHPERVQHPDSFTMHPERVQHPDSLTIHPERVQHPDSLTIHPERVQPHHPPREGAASPSTPRGCSTPTDSPSTQSVQHPDSLTIHPERVQHPDSLTIHPERVQHPDSLTIHPKRVQHPDSLTIHPERVQHPDSLTIHPERVQHPDSLTIHPERVQHPDSLTIHPERVQHPDSLTIHPERVQHPDSLTIHPERNCD
ncbi:UNVERIFIED_CONTAM: hypothetical protein FKN15_019549 [Acipenser sinensis]